LVTPFLTDAHYRKPTIDVTSKNKYRPTPSQTLASLVQIRLCSIPSILVRIADLVAKRLDTIVDGIEELESNVEILLEVEAVRQVSLDVLRLFPFTLFDRPFEFEEVVEIGLDGDAQSSVDIL
jgi:hypothetical protein